MNTLLIDTSNQPMSIALMKDEEVLAAKTTNNKTNHSVQLMPGIQELFTQCDLTKENIDAIIVAQGPGSYTGVRIGVTVAKTLAYVLNVRLFGVSSLEALAATTHQTNQLIVPLFDARRDAVYAGVYQHQHGQLKTIINDGYITIDELLTQLHSLKEPYIFIGQDAKKLSARLDGPIEENLPDAAVMLDLIKQPANIYTFTPNYLKLSEAERNWLNQQQNN